MFRAMDDNSKPYGWQPKPHGRSLKTVCPVAESRVGDCQKLYGRSLKAVAWAMAETCWTFCARATLPHRPSFFSPSPLSPKAARRARAPGVQLAALRRHREADRVLEEALHDPRDDPRREHERQHDDRRRPRPGRIVLELGRARGRGLGRHIFSSVPKLKREIDERKSCYVICTKPLEKVLSLAW